MQLFRTVFLVLLVSTVLVSCRSNPKPADGTEVEEINMMGGEVGVIGEVSASGLGDPVIPDSVDLNVSNNNASQTNILLSESIVYFEYDSINLTAAGEATVLANAQYLLSVNVNILLEGHTDERGTREYNLALGEERAETVSELLQVSGVAGSRIQIVSYGEERPVALGNAESAWSQNRRVEILYE